MVSSKESRRSVKRNVPLDNIRLNYNIRTSKTNACRRGTSRYRKKRDRWCLLSYPLPTPCTPTGVEWLTEIEKNFSKSTAEITIFAEHDLRQRLEALKQIIVT